MVFNPFRIRKTKYLIKDYAHTDFSRVRKLSSKFLLKEGKKRECDKRETTIVVLQAFLNPTRITEPLLFTFLFGFYFQNA